MQIAELQALIEQYLQGARSARDLFRGIQAFAIPLTADDADIDAKRLYGRTWLLLTERSQGDRTDEQVRRALRAELKRFQRESPVLVSLPHNDTATASAESTFIARPVAALPLPSTVTTVDLKGWLPQASWRPRHSRNPRSAGHGSAVPVPI